MPRRGYVSVTLREDAVRYLLLCKQVLCPDCSKSDALIVCVKRALASSRCVCPEKESEESQGERGM